MAWWKVSAPPRSAPHPLTPGEGRWAAGGASGASKRLERSLGLKLGACWNVGSRRCGLSFSPHLLHLLLKSASNFPLAAHQPDSTRLGLGARPTSPGGAKLRVAPLCILASYSTGFCFCARVKKKKTKRVMWLCSHAHARVLGKGRAHRPLV